MMDCSLSMQTCKSLQPLWSGAFCSHTEAIANDHSKWQQSIEALLLQLHINLAGDPVDE